MSAETGKTYPEKDVMALVRAAKSLYEVVQMDESVGICLSSRAECLTLGDVLGTTFEQEVKRA